MSVVVILCSTALFTPAGTTVVPLAGEVKLHFLGRADGALAITSEENDPFFQTLTQLDIEVRLAEPMTGVERAHQIRQLKKLFADAVCDWSTGEVSAVTEACRVVHAAAQSRAPALLPADWKFVRTNGGAESGAAYTRADAIILPEAKLKGTSSYLLARLIAHETAHVYSRTHPENRDALYGVFGFRHVGPVALGDALANRRLTNPDGPGLEHVIRVRSGTETFNVVLVTYSKYDSFASAHGRRVFDYLAFGLFPVDELADGCRVRPSPAGLPARFRPGEVSGFFEQVGRNTAYLLHPDEILAENIAILLTHDLPGAPAQGPADPELLRKLSALLQR